jgi:hypothetical protein
MKRITPEEVVEAYAKTGLKPARDTAYGPECCGIGAIAAVNGVVNDSPYAWARHKYDSDYVDGFLCGFDDRSMYQTDGPFRIGFNDGLAAAAAVFQGS